MIKMIRNMGEFSFEAEEPTFEKKVSSEVRTNEMLKLLKEMGKFEIYDDDGHSFQFMDTVIYNEDGSYVQCVTSDTDILDPNTGKPLKAMTITTHNADGTPRGNMKLHWEMHGDTTQYTAEPFSITEESLNILMDGLSTLVDRPDNDSIYNIVEQMPQFPGGDPAMFEFISKNVKYPQKAKDEGIQGRVFIQFVVEKDGSVGEVKLLRGIGGGCDEEGIRVVKSMPKWTPGQQAGKAVRVLYTLPIFFKLDDQTPQPNNKGDMQPDKNGVYQIAEEMPRFPGDDKALMVYLQKNLIMPEKYKGNTDENPSLAEYRTFVKFVVNEDGSISDIQLLRKSAEFKDLDEEAIRVVKSMPNWEPGKKEGKPVKVYFNLPIVFKFRK
jgi:TonB family protein